MYSEFNWKPENQFGHKFLLGRVLVTPSVLKLVPADLISSWLSRHQNGDWGVISASDWEANNNDLQNGSQLLSAYKTPGGVKIWIITAGDRSTTVVMLPSEY
jgi:hypothetical protein